MEEIKSNPIRQSAVATSFRIRVKPGRPVAPLWAALLTSDPVLLPGSGRFTQTRRAWKKNKKPLFSGRWQMTKSRGFCLVWYDKQTCLSVPSSVLFPHVGLARASPEWISPPKAGEFLRSERETLQDAFGSCGRCFISRKFQIRTVHRGVSVAQFELLELFIYLFFGMQCGVKISLLGNLKKKMNTWLWFSEGFVWIALTTQDGLLAFYWP